MEIIKDDAVALFGSAANLARALGISTAAVAQWQAGKNIPVAQALRIRYEIKPEAFETPLEAAQ